MANSFLNKRANRRSVWCSEIADSPTLRVKHIMSKEKSERDRHVT